MSNLLVPAGAPRDEARYLFSDIPGPVILRGYYDAKGTHRASDALVIAYLAVIDQRKLYREAGHPSMHAFCMAEMQATYDVANNRIRVARTARQFPAIFPMLADGRLHQQAVLQLAAHLRPHTVQELLAAAANRTCAEIEKWLAERFPRTEMMSWTMGTTTTKPPDSCQLVAPRVGMTSQPQPEPPQSSDEPLLPPPTVPAPRTLVTPIAARTFGVQFMMDGEMSDDFEHLRALLGHEAPTVEAVFRRALKSLRREVDRKKFAATDRPRQPRQCSSANPRQLPNSVRRAVWRRDQYQCAFRSDEGRRCEARSGLEIDHIQPVARGGGSTVDNLRLLCRAHNQLAAEKSFGAGFMEEKREAAKRARTR